MVQSVLGSLTLGYRPIWSRSRKLAAVQLYVHTDATPSVNAAHLVRALQELWSANSPALLLSPHTPALLSDLLDNAPRGAPGIEVRGQWLLDPALRSRVQAAQQRGLDLVWRGPLASRPAPELLRGFSGSLLSLSAAEGLVALRSSGSDTRDARASMFTAAPPPAAGPRPANPVLAGQMYEHIPSRALMVHCLDDSGALALAGWPSEDVLHSLRLQPQQPSHAVIVKLLKAIEAEQSLETFEAIMGEDPLLAYRFMVYTNSAALGLRTGIDSLRRGMVMMGYSSIKRWLADQLPHASREADMQPVRQSMVMRAHLLAHVLNAGVENDLRREIYLCGLFSQLDQLTGDSMGSTLRRLPLLERIYEAHVMRTGPYAGALQVAIALEHDDPAKIAQLCEAHEIDRDEVNRALLRVLSELRVDSPS